MYVKGTAITMLIQLDKNQINEFFSPIFINRNVFLQ